MFGLLIAIIAIGLVCMAASAIDDGGHRDLSVGNIVAIFASVVIILLAVAALPDPQQVYKSDAAKACFPYVVTHYQHNIHTAVFDCANDGKLRVVIVK